jgi:transposase InsO family protein
LALIVLSVVEQRLDAVRAVLDGAEVTEVAARMGVHRSTVHRWVARYLSGQLAGLADGSHRPHSSPRQANELVEVAVAEMRREHPRWGSRRIRLEMLRRPGPWAGETMEVPSERTIDRILHRHGLLRARPRKRPKDSYQRFERPGPMQLWQMDIVGGVRLVNPVTGELREAKVVTAVDDHSRYCVIAKVVERATGRAVCLALAEALVRFGVPEEINSDNGKQFTGRFGRHGTTSGEVLFDKVCRRNGITHRLTAPASPNQNGKVGRFHGTFRPDFLDVAGPFTSVEQAQAAVDAWVAHYNAERPHQALDQKVPVTPAERFVPVPAGQRSLVDLWLPPALEDAGAPAPEPAEPDGEAAEGLPALARAPRDGGPVEFDRVVPPSGNLQVAGKQFWLGPARGRDGDPVLGRLRPDLPVRGRHPGQDPAFPPVPGRSAQARRWRGRPRRAVPAAARRRHQRRRGRAAGLPQRPGQPRLAPAAGRRDSRRAARRDPHRARDADVLRPRNTDPAAHPAQPAHPAETARLRGARPAGPVPHPSAGPSRVQRRISATGVIMVAGQKIALGRVHAGQTVTVLVSDLTLAVELGDGETRTVPRTTTQPVRSIKGQRPRSAASPAATVLE